MRVLLLNKTLDYWDSFVVYLSFVEEKNGKK